MWVGVLVRVCVCVCVCVCTRRWLCIRVLGEREFIILICTFCYFYAASGN